MPQFSENIYANGLNLLPQLGPVRLTQLFKYYGSFQKVWEVSPTDFAALGLSSILITDLIATKTNIDLEQEYQKLKNLSIEIILLTDSDYPNILKEITVPPPILYVRGNKQILNTAAIGVVGTRKISPYGKLATDHIVQGLATSNLTIVSGLAYGVDAQALSCAQSVIAPCIAVLASPLDDASISPKSNFQLAQKIINNGCLVSEYALGATVGKGNFLARNRIISGLSLGVVVIEADADSGSLITARYALEQNREIFAVPGSIFSQVSKGTNDLLKRGAKLVGSSFDILEELNLSAQPQPTIELGIITVEEQAILNVLSREPMLVDDLVRQLHKPVAEINAVLVMLEMQGRVKNAGNAKFIKIR